MIKIILIILCILVGCKSDIRPKESFNYIYGKHREVSFLNASDYKDGYKAALAGLKPEDNPYLNNSWASSDSEHWSRGYVDAKLEMKNN